ncbi:hypothetical protein CTI12_AA559120 [Artemisia annua]|uniref:WEB family n=1 Tax=Artemisia annua TaxID=35608 RepID=A0A2U1KSV9_ARTAN|nr:hypothetical protein CTI12_AA559120 [Artemisia annua]
MFGLIRTRQNVASFTASPGVSPSPGPAATGSPKGSPNAVVGEIDTRAPFQSVKAAVNLFGEASPKSGKPRLRFKTPDERVLEKETQLHWTLKELDKYKELLKSAESTKTQARRDLEKANQSLHELTNKLEMISEGKQAAIETTEAANARAQELEVLKTSESEANDAWQEDVDNERHQYKTSANELISIKQELTSLKQDFDAALEAKLSAFQQAADAQHAAKVNHQKMVELSKEVDTMRETLNRVKRASEKAHEEHVNLIEEKEALIESKKKAKDDLDLKIESLRKEHQVSELRILGQKLEEKNEAINVLEEQLSEVRVADMETLDNAKGDDIKREQQQTDLDKIKLEIEEATSELKKATNSIKELELKIQETMSESEKARKEEEAVKKQEETLKRQADQSENANKEAEEKLEVALRELEKAKAAEALASDQIHKRTKDSGSAMNANKIKLTAQEYEALKRKGDEARKAADTKVATAMSQVETIKKKERQTIIKLKKSMEETTVIEVELAEALKIAEMAEAAKQAIENELSKWKNGSA